MSGRGACVVVGAVRGTVGYGRVIRAEEQGARSDGWSPTYGGQSWCSTRFGRSRCCRRPPARNWSGCSRTGHHRYGARGAPPAEGTASNAKRTNLRRCYSRPATRCVVLAGPSGALTHPRAAAPRRAPIRGHAGPAACWTRSIRHFAGHHRRIRRGRPQRLPRLSSIRKRLCRPPRLPHRAGQATSGPEARPDTEARAVLRAIACVAMRPSDQVQRRPPRLPPRPSTELLGIGD